MAITLSCPRCQHYYFRSRIDLEREIVANSYYQGPKAAEKAFTSRCPKCGFRIDILTPLGNPSLETIFAAVRADDKSTRIAKIGCMIVIAIFAVWCVVIVVLNALGLLPK